MSDTRVIDWWMLFIELGILLLMVCGILWGIPAWIAGRREKRELQLRLANLAPPVAEALRNLVLKGIGLNEENSAALRQFPRPIIERDYTMGWRVLPEHRKYV